MTCVGTCGAPTRAAVAVVGDGLRSFVREPARCVHDLSAIERTNGRDPRGGPPHDPAMVSARQLHASTRDFDSSRRIAQACEEPKDFVAPTSTRQLLPLELAAARG